MSTRRTVLAGLLERLDSLDLSRAERTELRALLERELERYSERGQGRPSGPSSAVRDVQLLIDMRETLEALLADSTLGDADRAELERWREQYPATSTAALDAVARKQFKSRDAIRKAVTKKGDAVRSAHKRIELGGEPDAPERTTRPARRK